MTAALLARSFHRTIESNCCRVPTELPLVAYPATQRIFVKKWRLHRFIRLSSRWSGLDRNAPHLNGAAFLRFRPTSLSFDRRTD